MVSMGMGDDGALDGTPRVNIKIARRAVQAFGPLNDQILHKKLTITFRFQIISGLDAKWQKVLQHGKAKQRHIGMVQEWNQ